MLKEAGEGEENACLCLLMRTVRHPKLWLRDERGAELVEAAVVLPLIILLVLGMFWLGRAYNSLQTLTRAAREGARLAVTPTCASCGNTFPSEAEVRAVIDSGLLASSMDPAAVTNFSMQRQVVLNPGSVPEVRGVVISFNYPYDLVLPFIPGSLTTLTLPVTVRMREET